MNEALAAARARTLPAVTPGSLPLAAPRYAPHSRGGVSLAALDDDSGFTRTLESRARALGWSFQVLGPSTDPRALAGMRLDALVLDPSGLEDDFWTYVESIHAEAPRLVITVCSEHSSVAERVRALRLGVDDWVGKPCHPEEVLARTEAALRRTDSGDPLDVVAAGELEIRPDMFEAFAGGKAAELTRREFELLWLLAGAGGRVVPRDDIYERVWGYAMAHGDRSVDVFVRKLRQKLRAVSPGWRYLHTHYGIGYRFEAEPDA